MYSDAIDLRDFYDSALGQVARRMIRRRLRQLWPDARGRTVLGLGYATPFLRPWLGEAERVISLMPARQGVAHWPRGGRNVVALAEETMLPLADMSVDRVMLVHAAEATENVRGLMREIWRVLAGNGRLMVVVPNRRGIWARVERTPFGQGRPYSAGQLSTMLREHLFVPERAAHALFIPPVRWPFLLTAAPAWENIGGRWFSGFSGVVMIEASKQLYQITAAKDRAAKRAPVLVPLAGATARDGAAADFYPAAATGTNGFTGPEAKLAPACGIGQASPRNDSL